jgi:tRNA(Ile)-lysidine synthase
VVAALPKPPAVARVLQQVASMARRHSMFEPASSAVVAVSGGPDSLCLLHSLVRLKRLLRIEPVCFHFDHRLRPGSDADARYVRSQAQRLGIPCLLREADSKPGKGESVEAWARAVRYEALTAVVEELGGTAAVGHTADDQAETVLLALLRGGGLEAIAGMSPVSRPIVRPLLETTREETEAFCRALRLRPRQDPMNEDPSYMRVALRRRVIPTLEQSLGRNVRETLARTADLLRLDAEFLDQLATVAFPTVAETDGQDSLVRTGPLAMLPPSLAGRVVRRVLLEQGILPEASHVEAVVELGGARPGTAISLPGSLKAKRERGYVRVSRPSPGPRPSGHVPR